MIILLTKALTLLFNYYIVYYICFGGFVKILLVDDTATDLGKMKQVIERAGHRAILAKDGLEAVEKSLSEKPDMIFMDILMPRMDGFRATSTIRANPETASIPIVLVSARTSASDLDLAIKRGAQALIGKPFTPSQLLEQISNHHQALSRD